MSWFDDLKTPKVKVQQDAQRVSKVPEGLWVKCTSCNEVLQSKVLKESFQVCPECNHHFRMSAAERIQMLCDPGKFEEYAEDLVSTDPLEFDDTKPYKDRLKSTAEKLSMGDAIVVGKASLEGVPYHLGVFEFRFMGGSMGIVVGEKLTQLFEKAIEDKIPAVTVSASGGARMQEGIYSLMQMAKTSALVEKMRQERIPYISILTDPTTGGVAASFAMLGDVIIAEPKALIGFAGPRVIQQTIRQSLPEGFQRSEFLRDHGFVDRIVDRKLLPKELKEWLTRLGQNTCKF